MKIYTFSNRKQTQGFTLIELLLVIVGAVVLLGLGLVIFRQVQGSTAALGGSEGALQLSAGIKSIFPTPKFTGLTSAMIISARKAPDNMVSGTTLVNGWGGVVTPAPATYPTGGAADNAYSITFTGVPTDACNSMAASLAANFRQITIDATVVKDEAAATPVVFSTPAVVTACAVNAVSTMKFVTT